MVYTLLENADSTATPGKRINLAKTSDEFTVEVWTENITALTINLEGSISGIRWFPIIAYPFTATDITNQNASFSVTGKPYKLLRGRPSAISGTNPLINMIVEAFGDDE